MKGSARLCLLLGVLFTVAVVSGLKNAPVQAQDKGAEVAVTLHEGEREVRIEDRRLRFVIRSEWKMQAQDGVYVVRSDDQKMVMMLFTLDDPREIPETMSEMDKLVPVQNAKFSDPHTGMHRGIPTEVLFGRGVLMPVEIPVEMAIVTMEIGGKPVLAMFYVHKSAFDTHFAHVKRTIDSFSLILTPAEAQKLRDKSKKGPKLTPSKP